MGFLFLNDGVPSMKKLRCLYAVGTRKKTKKSIDKWDSLLFGLLNKFHFRLKSFGGFLSPRLMDVNFHQISIFYLFFRFRRSSESNVNNPKENSPFGFYFFYLKQKQIRPMEEKPFDSGKMWPPVVISFLLLFFFDRALWCLFAIARLLYFPAVYYWIIHPIFIRRLTTYSNNLHTST